MPVSGKIEHVPLAKLKGYDKNARTHSPAQVEQPEEWRAIPGIEDAYEASSIGRIRSLTRTLAFTGRWGLTYRKHRGRVLVLKTKPNGYMFFYTDGAKYLHVNRAVASAFHGEPPTPKHEAAHRDGEKSNNRPSNLVWATPGENAAHRRDHGTDTAGERNGMAILNARAVREIRRLPGTLASIASQFGISAATVSLIRLRKSWRHVA